MAIVMEKKIGNTTVKIDDTSCRDKTPEEVRNILKRIAIRAQNAIAEAERNVNKVS